MSIRPHGSPRHFRPLYCPLCTALDDGVSEPELWEHLVLVHAAIDHVAAAVAELANLPESGSTT